MKHYITSKSVLWIASLFMLLGTMLLLPERLDAQNKAFAVRADQTSELSQSTDAQTMDRQATCDSPDIEGESLLSETGTRVTYSVSLIQGEGGTIAIAEKIDPNHVPEGMTLTIIAEAERGYELATLTANGIDIKKKKKFQVMANTVVRATFLPINGLPPHYTVTLIQGEGGTIALSEKIDPNHVAHGSWLTIIDTPDEGYELSTLTANGIDIKTTKKFLVIENTEVRATFLRKGAPAPTYTVTLTQSQGGTIAIAEKIDPNHVPHGTWLTITDMPDAGYALATLTANGIDIKATKRFLVIENTEVKAQFLGSTLINNIQTVTPKVYPNPTKGCLRVKGAEAKSPLYLYSLRGELVLTSHVDENGSVDIDLTNIPPASYLLQVGTTTYKIEVQR